MHCILNWLMFRCAITANATEEKKNNVEPPIGGWFKYAPIWNRCQRLIMNDLFQCEQIGVIICQLLLYWLLFIFTLLSVYYSNVCGMCSNRKKTLSTRIRHAHAQHKIKCLLRATRKQKDQPRYLLFFPTRPQASTRYSHYELIPHTTTKQLNLPRPEQHSEQCKTFHNDLWLCKFTLLDDARWNYTHNFRIMFGWVKHTLPSLTIIILMTTYVCVSVCGAYTSSSIVRGGWCILISNNSIFLLHYSTYVADNHYYHVIYIVLSNPNGFLDCTLILIFTSLVLLLPTVCCAQKSAMILVFCNYYTARCCLVWIAMHFFVVVVVGVFVDACNNNEYHTHYHICRTCEIM